MSATQIRDIDICVFDAYGTLFDYNSAAARCKDKLAEDWQAFSELWRRKQLEYTWLRSLMGRYEDFWKITEDALRWAIARLGLAASEADVRRLMDAYLSLACFPEVPATLASLSGRPRAILSNGAPAMLAAAVAASGLEKDLDYVLSVDAVKTYKPSPTVYALGPKALGLDARDVLFVSSNAWDVAGARSFGYQVAWCNRANAPSENLGLTADYEIRSLTDLPR